MNKGIMKKFAPYLLSTIFITLLFLLSSSPVKAQDCGESCGSGNTCTSPLTCVNGVCTSSTQCPSCTNNGQAGACTASMACPQGVQSQGSCTDPNTVCCVPQTNTGGTKACGETCVNGSECQTGYSCTNGFCVISPTCPACTGTSGHGGSCLDAALCAGIGKNANDGTCSLPGGGGVCCTDAPTGYNCSLTLQGPSYSGAATQIAFSSNVPNRTFYITYTAVTAGGGTCSTPGQFTTDANGNLNNGGGSHNFTVSCSPIGTYNINASITTAGAPMCSVTLNMTGGPTSAPVGNSPLGGVCQPTELDTAIGCINITNTNSLLSFLIPWGIGIAGGVALLLIIYAGFLITTSSGDPRRLAVGKELLTAAISGLILLIFAVFLLRVIGKNILNIPGL